jgi:hypothetical protein
MNLPCDDSLAVEQVARPAMSAVSPTEAAGKTARSTGSIAVVLLASFLAAIPTASAQQNPPHLAYVYPAGGQRGTTFQVKVGGQFLNAATNVFVSGSGVQAKAIDYARPMNQMQATQLRERLQDLQKLPASAEIQTELADLRLKLASFNRGISPVLAETATLQITLAPDADLGQHVLRLATPQGLSNPLVFSVGELPEFVEKQSEVRVLVAGINLAEVAAAESAEMSVTLPVTLNGRIVPRAARPQPAIPGQQFTPGDVDRYRFQARRGQKLVVAVSARELMPYLADAVPGWFQPAVALLDDKGNELAYADHYRFEPDPVLYYEIPKDGEYVVQIKDTLYRGREDFVYRIRLGELPFITGTFPLAGPAGGLLEVLEKEPDNSPQAAQHIKLPVIVNGRIDRPGDMDVFAFEGRAGDRIVAEVQARRLASPLDSVLRLTNAAGRQLAFNDDHDDPGAGLITHQADSLISATLPATGTYYVHVGDIQHNGGPEYAYRLRISPPRPDFELWVTPSAINAVGGVNVPITAHVLRRDGFSGSVALALKGAPRNFALSGGLVPAGQDQVRLTLFVPPVASQVGEPFNLNLEGRAFIEGREVVRAAVPADDMMQAFAYRHLVPAEGLWLAVARRVAFRTPARILGEPPLKIPAGGSVRLRVQAQLPPNNNVTTLHFELSEPPEGIELRSSSPLEDAAEIVLQCDAEKVKADLRGNLIVIVLGERQVTPPNGGVPNRQQRVPLGTLPALPFEILKH